MVNAFHGRQTKEQGIHGAIAFEYADAAARNAAGPFQEYDNDKLARQLDTDEVYILTDYSVPTWELFAVIGGGGGAVDSVFGRTGNVVAVSGDYDSDQIDNVSAIAGASVSDALETLNGLIVGGGGGTVTGPASTTDNAIARWSGTDGYNIQNSGIIIDDSDNMTGVLTLNGVTVESHASRHENGGADEIEISALGTSETDTSLVLKPDGVGGVSWTTDSGSSVNLDGYVFDTRQVIAGDGLTGGGDLSADRTFDVVANADGSIVVNANDIQVGVLANDTQHGNLGGGLLHDLVSASTAGFFSSDGYNKLEGIEDGAQANTVDSVFGRTGDVIAVSGDYDSDQIDNVSAIAGSSVSDALETLNGLIVGGGSGTVTGPDTTTDNAIARWSGTDGYTIQNSGIIIDDSDNITGVITINGVTIESHASRHENGGADEIEISALGTSETDTSLVLKPDGTGGVSWVTDEGGASLDGYVFETRQVIAGDGLTGGGDLSADRTFDVVANADGSIVVNANDIQVGTLANDAQHGNLGGGNLHEVADATQAGFLSIDGYNKLESIEDGAQANTVDSVFGRTGDVIAVASDYDSSQIDNDSSVPGTYVSDALDYLDGQIGLIDLDGYALDSDLQTHITDTTNPHATDIGNLGSGTLAELNAIITDATLDDSGDPRTPTAHALTHEDGGSDEIEISNLPTAETDTTLVLKPDGAGGVSWVADEGGASLDGYVFETRQVIAGDGLTGGGDLSADRTFDVVANADGSIVVNANDIQVGTLANDSQHGNLGGGLLHDVANSTTAGFFSSDGYNKLEGIEDGAQANTVDSVFGRTGDVIAVSGDYDSDQIDNASTISGASVSDALETLNSLIVGGGSGTVTGPSSTTDNAITRWSGTDGYTIQNSGVILDDLDNITGVTTINGVTIESHASRHENGGADEIEISALGTSETDTTLVLKPDGVGGVSWVTDEGGASLDGYVFETRQVIAGDGLTGGGDLSADRTFDVVANADGSIVVNANDIQVGVLATDAQHGNLGGGLLHDVANSTTAGFFSSDGYNKLEGIEDGAQANTVDSVFGRIGDVIAVSGDYDASQIDNDSTVPGTYVSDALDYLDGQISLIDLDGYVFETRQVIAGDGLTGGGDLSADRTFDVVANADGSIVVNANDIQVGTLANDSQHGNLGGGLLHDVANSTTAGFLSSDGYNKLEGIEDGAQANTVDSVFGRTGDVIAVSGDYDSDQVDNASTVAGVSVSDALETLNSLIVGGGSGTVTGPDTTTDNAIARWSGTDGYTIQNSGVIIDDSDNITGVLTLNGVTIESHASRHESGGADEIDGYQLAIIYIPSNYSTPSSDILGQHLFEIDQFLGNVGDVVGIGLSQDHEIPRYDSTTGKIIQTGSNAFLYDNGAMELNGQLDMSGNSLIQVGSINLIGTSEIRGSVDSTAVRLIRSASGIVYVGQNDVAGDTATSVSIEANSNIQFIVDDPGVTALDLTSTIASFEVPLDMGSNNITNVGTVDGRDVSVDGSTLDSHVADDSIHFTLNDIGLDGYVPETRQVIAGDGLTGGGDLSADRTFDVVANADGSIVVNANDIQVGVLATDAQHGNLGGGLLHDVANSTTAGFLSIDGYNKLEGIEDGAQANTVDSVFGRIGDVTAVASDYDASQIDNDSSVPGTYVSDALDYLDGQISLIDLDGYVFLAGRTGGQILYGGTGAGDDLILYSTSNATLGEIQVRDVELRLLDNVDVTKKAAFEVSGLTTATTRTMTVPDLDINLGGFPTGPVTDNVLMRFDGTTGRLSQDSAVTLDDSGNLTGVGTVNGVTVETHASRHISAGADEIDGDQLDIDWNPTNYTPTTAPAEVTSIDHLTAHLAGIDAELAGFGDVTGPGSATDNAIARFDGTTGDLIQNSGITISDSDVVSGVNSIQLDLLDPVPAYSEGLIFYDDTEKTLAVYNDQSDVIHQLGQETHLRVYNDTGSTITNGSAVYITGAASGRPTVALAQADSAITARTIGLATHDIANVSEGIVTITGSVTLDTSGFSAGDPLYLSETTPGALTNVAPSGSNIRVLIGFAETSAVSGRIFVSITRIPFLDDKSLSIPGDLSISTDGSTLAAPRLIGFVDLSVGEGARLQYGDPANGWQNGFGQAMQMWSYHTLILQGDRTDPAAPAFETTSDIGVLIPNTTAASPALVVRGAAGQTGNLLEFQSSTPTDLTWFDASGNLIFGGTELHGRDFNEVTPADLTGQTDNYDPTDFGIADLLRQNLAGGSYTITGFAAPTGSDNHDFWITNTDVTSFVLTLANESASSTAANRIIGPGAADLTLDPGESAHLIYDDTSSRWRVVSVAKAAGGGSGDVTGPGSSTDNAIARFDGTGGKTLQNSALQITDDGYLDMNSGDIIEARVINYDGYFNNGTTGSSQTVVWGEGQKQRSELNAATVTVTHTFPGVGNYIWVVEQDVTTQCTSLTLTITGGDALYPDGNLRLGAGAGAITIVSIFYDGVDAWCTSSPNMNTGSVSFV